MLEICVEGVVGTGSGRSLQSWPVYYPPKMSFSIVAEGKYDPAEGTQ